MSDSRPKKAEIRLNGDLGGLGNHILGGDCLEPANTIIADSRNITGLSAQWIGDLEGLRRRAGATSETRKYQGRRTHFGSGIAARRKYDQVDRCPLRRIDRPNCGHPDLRVIVAWSELVCLYSDGNKTDVERRILKGTGIGGNRQPVGASGECTCGDAPLQRAAHGIQHANALRQYATTRGNRRERQARL